MKLALESRNSADGNHHRILFYWWVRDVSAALALERYQEGTETPNVDRRLNFNSR